jgi:hypothetical protein
MIDDDVTMCDSGAVYLFALTSESEAAERRQAADPDSHSRHSRYSNNGRRSKQVIGYRSSAPVTSSNGIDMPPLPGPSQPGALVLVTAASAAAQSSTGAPLTIAVASANGGTRSWRGTAALPQTSPQASPHASPTNAAALLNDLNSNSSSNMSATTLLQQLQQQQPPKIGNRSFIGWRSPSPNNIYEHLPPDPPVAMVIRTSSETQPKSGRLGPPPNNGAAATAANYNNNNYNQSGGGGCRY